MKTASVRNLNEVMPKDEPMPPASWQLRVIQSEECMSYVAWNTESKEALVVDPKKEDWEAYLSVARDLPGYTWLGVLDTHTHADHISIAADLAQKLGAPLIMHQQSPSQRIHLRVSRDTDLPARSSPVKVFQTPGHTGDSLTIFWGPYIFGGDTLLYGDTGRDDLPGGNPQAHYQSLVRLKEAAKPEMVLLPGHDNKGGRASSWATQLKINTSLTQSKEDFVRESSAFEAPAPKDLKVSLRENFK